eukprot:gene28810-25815_t
MLRSTTPRSVCLLAALVFGPIALSAACKDNAECASTTGNSSIWCGSAEGKADHCQSIPCIQRLSREHKCPESNNPVLENDNSAGGDPADSVEAAIACASIAKTSPTFAADCDGSEHDCVVEKVSGYDVCMLASSAEALKNPEVQAAMACNSITKASPTFVADCEGSEHDCVVEKISGYDVCMAASSAEALKTPEAQAAMACGELTAKGKSPCCAGSGCGWGSSTGFEFCAAATSLAYVPGGDLCGSKIGDNSTDSGADTAAPGIGDNSTDSGADTAAPGMLWSLSAVLFAGIAF